MPLHASSLRIVDPPPYANEVLMETSLFVVEELLRGVVLQVNVISVLGP